MKKLYILLFILFTATISAQVDRSVMPKPGPAPEINLDDPQTFELKNGLKVLVVANHKLPRVSIQLRIDNPPLAEGDKSGVSSLTGSLLGMGSKSISKDDFNEEVDFLGARMFFGSQSAFASSLSKYFPRIIELMADACINPNFTQEEFDKEKNKLITGLKTEEKDVKAISSRVQTALAYGTDHPFGEFTTEETLNNVTLGDVKNYYQNNFVPANAYLIVIGDVNLKETKTLVKKFFTPWTKATPPSFSYTNPADAHYTQLNFVDVPNAVQSEITVQNLVNLKMKDPDYLPVLMANEILGGGGAGRLYSNLREDKGFTYGSYSGIGNDKNGPSRFRAVAAVRNVVTDSSVVEILKEIDLMRNTDVSEEELTNAKAKYLGRFVMALENPETIARYAFNIKTEGLDKNFYKSYLEKISAISVTDVKNAAQKYFSADKLRIVVAGKGSEILENLEKITINEKPIPVKYFDKFAAPVDKPNYKMAVPSDVTVGSIISKYVDAIGGKDKLAGVNAYAMNAEAEMQGMKLNLEMKKTDKKQFMQDVKVMGNSMSKQVLNGDSGYVVMQGQRKDMDASEIAKVSLEADPFPELNYTNVSLEGIEDVNGQKAYKIKVSDEKTAFFSTETGLKIQEVTKAEMMGQEIVSTMNFGDYKEVNGILFPYTISQSMGPQSIDFTVSEIKINEGVSDADFE